MSVEFVTEKVLKSNSKKEVTTLDIIINDVDTGRLPYMSRSGGERVKAALSVILALSEIKSSKAGEAYNHVPDDKNRYRATYTTFVRLSSSQWRFAGYCYRGETTNRVDVETSLERRIKETRTNG